MTTVDTRFKVRGGSLSHSCCPFGQIIAAATCRMLYLSASSDPLSHTSSTWNSDVCGAPI